jgi:hypothetical protein
MLANHPIHFIGQSNIIKRIGDKSHHTTATRSRTAHHRSKTTLGTHGIYHAREWRVQRWCGTTAGSNDPIGFSTCNENGKLATICSWNDVTQAEAYASTLLAFYKAFPEYATNELYLTGESYAG